jgi:hypothetical protein
MTISSIEKGRKIEYYGKEKELSNVSYKLYECISDFYRSCINMHKAYDKDNKHKNIHQILYKYVKLINRQKRKTIVYKRRYVKNRRGDLLHVREEEQLG